MPQKQHNLPNIFFRNIFLLFSVSLLSFSDFFTVIFVDIFTTHFQLFYYHYSDILLLFNFLVLYSYFWGYVIIIFQIFNYYVSDTLSSFFSYFTIILMVFYSFNLFNIYFGDITLLFSDILLFHWYHIIIIWMFYYYFKIFYHNLRISYFSDI